MILAKFRLYNLGIELNNKWEYSEALKWLFYFFVNDISFIAALYLDQNYKDALN